ncbi:hypothetical protein EW146_g2465 [Bondarzewia mesenterica]|uniref:DH domain-containing protein n=1 Tax=Bondarzewia mesenterica TaxID=1095465 RepID=A0A4S4M132_9AGAM|nr:hypothetical protein EW146_g2465 [Bondarzewia mesenterica]
MTNPQNTPITTGPSTPVVSFPATPHDRTSAMPPSLPPPPRSPSASTSRLRRAVMNPKATPIPPVPMTPKSSSASRPQPPPVTPKAKPKPILKSVLSGSSSSTIIPNGQSAEPNSPSKGSPSRSSRLMRSVLGKKGGRAIPGPQPGAVTPNSASNSSTRDRERSRTDPGHVSKIPTRSPYLSRTPQPNLFSSSIPRQPSTNLNERHPSSLRAEAVQVNRRAHNDSGSELELWSERGRALVVTNAEIVPSSSESNSETDGDLVGDSPVSKVQTSWGRSPGRFAKNAYTRPGQQSSTPPEKVGLGLGISEPKMEEFYNSRDVGFRDSFRRSSGTSHTRVIDEKRTYPGERSQKPADAPSGSMTHTISGRKSPRELIGDHEGQRSTEILANPWEIHNLEMEDSERRRRNALMGIVNELENGLSTLNRRNDTDESFDSEYTGQQGLAISGSTEMQDYVGTVGGNWNVNGRQRSTSRPSQLRQRSSINYPTEVHIIADSQRGGLLRTSPRPNYSDNMAKGNINYSTRIDDETHGDDDVSASEYTSEEEEDLNDDHFEDITPKLPLSLRQSRPAFSLSQNHTRPSPDPKTPLSSHWQRRELSFSSSNSTLRHVPGRSISDNRGSVGGTGSTDGQRYEHSTPPQAPRRRSLYGDARVPSVSLAAGSDTRRTRPISGVSRPRDDHPLSETYSHHQNMNFLEAQEREEFGLPPSSSEASELLSRAESVSSLESRRWQDGGEGFSFGAEAIFKHLTEVGAGRLDNTASSTRRETKSGDVPVLNQHESTPMHSSHTSPNLYPSQTRTTLSASSSAQSIYEDNVPVQPWQHRERDLYPLDHSPDIRTWRSTLPASAYRSLLERYGETEMNRQEIIWDICESEQAFIKRLRTVVDLFIRPLRLQDSRKWISGVPSDVARLFDWLEDIVNLHSQIFSALHMARARQYPLVMRIAEVLRGFVPRLEVHQPYLVRVDEVTTAIKRIVTNPQNDFGEFIRIQQERQECQEWSLETVLISPVNRLSQYPVRFRRLWDATPRNHLDHISTFSLLHSTETMIHIMREVKIREEEYDLVKDIMSRIHGLPPSVQLARRERRFLARGRLLRAFGSDKLRAIKDANYVYPSFGPATVDELRSPGSKVSRAVQNGSVQRQSRLINAVKGWKASPSLRSDSLRSTASSTFSTDTYLTVSSSTPPISPMSPFDSSRDTAISESTGKWSGNRTLPSSQQNFSTLSASTSDSLKHTPVQAFVFTDLIVLASSTRNANKSQANATGNEAERETWSLLDDSGICRILGVVEERENIILDLLPMDTDDLQTGVIPDSVPVISITFTVPSSSSTGKVFNSTTVKDIHTKWLSAFRHILPMGQNVDLDLDSQQSVMTILASGLPLPKSPSVQIEEVLLGIGSDSQEQEREERGWWSLRFQTVLREMQKTDISFAEAPGSLASGFLSSTGAARARKGASQPRRLKLPSMSSSESVAFKNQVPEERRRFR